MLRQLQQRSTLARGAAGVSSVFPLVHRLSVRRKTEDADDTHPDFKPVSLQPDNAASVHEYIAADVAKHSVLVYMKGTPTAPQCVKYASRNVLQDAALREGIKTFTNWPTIPQVFIAGEFVGGSDILMTMHTDGELAAKLKK